MKVIRFTSQALVEFKGRAFGLKGEEVVSAQDGKSRSRPRIRGRRGPQTRAEELDNYMSPSPTPAEIHADLMDAAIVNDDEVISGCGVGSGALTTIPVSKLEAKPEVLEPCRLEEFSSPPLAEDMRSYRGYQNEAHLDSMKRMFPVAP